MAELIKFDVHRANCLLEKVFQQTERVRLDVLGNQSKLSAIAQTIETTAQALDGFSSKLEKYRIACEKYQRINEECLRVLEEGDLEELENLRNKLLERNTEGARKARRPILVSVSRG